MPLTFVRVACYCNVQNNLVIIFPQAEGINFWRHWFSAPLQWWFALSLDLRSRSKGPS